MEINNLKPALIDVPVFVTFFVRPETFIHVFNAIREARPSILFLVADGPRDGYPDDYRLNEESKKIAENVDWECKVYRRYSDVNLGIDSNSYLAEKWAFQIVDRMILLEDDHVPSQSFFRFCADLLEKYKDDTRIYQICGMNHLGNYEKPNADYFFSKGGSVWGTAVWKRSFDTLDNELNYLNDKYALKLLKENTSEIMFSRLFKKGAKQRIINLQSEKIVSSELIEAAAFYLNNKLNIVSSKNLISCIGISENSGHSVNHPLKLPKRIRGMFNMKTYELNFPLVHPSYVLPDNEYERNIHKIRGRNRVVKFYGKIEGKIRRIIIDLFFSIRDYLLSKKG